MTSDTGPGPVHPEAAPPAAAPPGPAQQEAVRPVSDEDRVWVNLAAELTPAKSLERVDTPPTGWSAP